MTRIVEGHRYVGTVEVRSGRPEMARLNGNLVVLIPLFDIGDGEWAMQICDGPVEWISSTDISGLSPCPF